MKLPAVCIVAAFASGIALCGPLRSVPLFVTFGLVLLLLLAAAFFLSRNRLRIAAVVALLAWFVLGGLALRIDDSSLPPNLITRLLAERRLDASVALRWRGQLRQDPEPLPWGLRYDIELDEVESAGTLVAVAGGLRVSHFRSSPQAGDSALPPNLRAGDRVEALVRARPVRNFANPGAPDIAGNLARQGIHLTGSLRSGELLRRIDGPLPRLRHRLARIRGALLVRLDSLFETAPWSGAILRAMLLGDRSFVDRDRTESFQKSAAYHVLVIAGLHVAALAGFVFWFSKRLRLNLLTRTALTIAVLAFYVGVVEDRPPILRAGLMAAAYLTARLLYRRPELLNSIAVAALVILLARPSALSSPSFQLSFLSVGTIAGLALPWIARTSESKRRALAHLTDVTRDAAHPPLAAQFRLDLRAASAWLTRHLPGRSSVAAAGIVALPFRAAFALWELVVVSTAIQLGMLPLLARDFNRVSIVGPLANIPSVLLTGLIVPLGFLTLGLSFLWRSLGTALAKPLGWLVSLLGSSVDWFSGWHFSSYRIPGPPGWLLVVFLLILIPLATAARAKRRLWQWLLAAPVAVLVVLVAVHPFAPQLEKEELEVTVLDVGQGDSLFVAFPNGHTMLIDGGGTPGANREGGLRIGVDPGEEAVSPYLWSRGLKKLDVVALTHAHQDHIGGLAAVLENFRVRELWIGRNVDSASYRALLREAAARGVRVIHHTQGERMREGDVGEEVFWPVTTEGSDPPKNDDSLVVRLLYGSTAMLLPGDIERRVEDELDRGVRPLDAGFLKVAHHGSRTSTTPDWLAKVHPRIAAVSVGENNPFGHPNADVLERLAAAGARILRTDRHGAITALSDGQSISVRTFLNPPQP